MWNSQWKSGRAEPLSAGQAGGVSLLGKLSYKRWTHFTLQSHALHWRTWWQNAIPGAHRPGGLLGSDFPCVRAVLAKEGFAGPSSQTGRQVSENCVWPCWGTLGCRETNSLTSADRLFYLQLSWSVHRDQVVLSKLKTFFLLPFVKQERGSEEELGPQQLEAYLLHRDQLQTNPWVPVLLPLCLLCCVGVWAFLAAPVRNGKQHWLGDLPVVALGNRVETMFTSESQR